MPTEEFALDPHHIVVVPATFIDGVVAATTPVDLGRWGAFGNLQRRTGRRDRLVLAHDKQDGALDRPPFGPVDEGRGGLRLWSRCLLLQGRGNDANVAAELQDQVLELRRRDGAHRGKLRGGLIGVEHVERPIADGAALQMGVEKSDAEVGADRERRDAGGLLLRP